MASRSSDCPDSPTRLWQCSRTSVGVISALQAMRLPEKRCSCRARDACIRSRSAADGSPVLSAASFSYSTRGTSTKMSMRSSSGPEMRFW